eukprot:gene14464-biopygen2080
MPVPPPCPLMHPALYPLACRCCYRRLPSPVVACCYFYHRRLPSPLRPVKGAGVFLHFNHPSWAGVGGGGGCPRRGDRGERGVARAKGSAVVAAAVMVHPGETREKNIQKIPTSRPGQERRCDVVRCLCSPYEGTWTGRTAEDASVSSDSIVRDASAAASPRETAVHADRTRAARYDPTERTRLGDAARRADGAARAVAAVSRRGGAPAALFKIAAVSLCFYRVHSPPPVLRTFPSISPALGSGDAAGKNESGRGPDEGRMRESKGTDADRTRAEQCRRGMKRKEIGRKEKKKKIYKKWAAWGSCVVLSIGSCVVLSMGSCLVKQLGPAWRQHEHCSCVVSARAPEINGGGRVRDTRFSLIPCDPPVPPDYPGRSPGTPRTMQPIRQWVSILTQGGIYGDIRFSRQTITLPGIVNLAFWSPNEIHSKIILSIHPSYP